MAEKEYIERGAALKRIDHAISEYARHGEIVRFIGDCRSSIIYAPADDVVEVVRCIKCIYRDKKGVCEKFRQRYPFFPEDDFYCGFGAKMDGERKEQK